MNNFEKIKGIITEYLREYEADTEIVFSLHEASKNPSGESGINYLYDSEDELEVINMDHIAQYGYRKAKNAKGNVINSSDAFVNDHNDTWYFFEFKDLDIGVNKNRIKANVPIKAYSNWCMLLDILFHMHQKDVNYPSFTYEQPMDFANKHIQYVLVCSKEKNPNVYAKIRDCRLVGERYTPSYMRNLRDYLFADAYVYTEEEFEREIVKEFQY